MKRNDAELNVWIDEFAKQGYVTINRGKHLPWLFDARILSINTKRSLSIIRLDYRPDRYECATVDMEKGHVSEPENLFSIEEVQEWCNGHREFLDK
jgi:hypothetical protein